MHHIQRVRGVKYDLSTFSLSELSVAVGHAQRVLDEQQRFLSALLRERELRRSAGMHDVRPDAPLLGPEPARPAAAA